MRLSFCFYLDAVFAVIWKALRRSEVLTLDAYTKKLQDVFKEDGRIPNIEVETPMLIPAYDEWLKKAIDTKLARLHKEIQTQHSWRFEAVETDQYFPTGCKTSYKAYSSDAVVEIRKTPKALCLTPIGKHTGLEAFMVIFYMLTDCCQLTKCNCCTGL